MYPAIRAKNKLDTNTNITHMIYHIGISDLEVASNGTVYQVMFYSQVSSLVYIIFFKFFKLNFICKAIFAKFIPCFLLLTFTSLLISSLIVINKNNKKLNTGYKDIKIKKAKENKSFLKIFFQAKNAQELPENLLLVNFNFKICFYVY